MQVQRRVGEGQGDMGRAEPLHPGEKRAGEAKLTVGGRAPAGKSGVPGSSPSSTTNLLGVLGRSVPLSVLHLQKGWPR